MLIMIMIIIEDRVDVDHDHDYHTIMIVIHDLAKKNWLNCQFSAQNC